MAASGISTDRDGSEAEFKLRHYPLWRTFFVFREHTFWGNDRIKWLLRELARSSGGNVPDLMGNPLRCPHDASVSAVAPRAKSSAEE
ncbi:MAG: hypothetical protein ACREBC_12480 [Pyrinomonadaceae bacterium]